MVLGTENIWLIGNPQGASCGRDQGRVFQTDTDFDKMAMAPNGSPKQWQDFA
jgi:hypothetical protein